MDSKLKEIIEILTLKGKFISTMESCTGGGVANAITNIEGASEVLKFSAVTYSNEYKIKMGVRAEVIDKYSVYSDETAKEMSRNIAIFANANYGVGITGKLNRIDKNNLYGEDNRVFISIYDRDEDKYYEKDVVVDKASRKENKDVVINLIADELLKIL